MRVQTGNPKFLELVRMARRESPNAGPGSVTNPLTFGTHIGGASDQLRERGKATITFGYADLS
jgi:hypothetical protein